LAEKYNGCFFDGYRIFGSIPVSHGDDLHLYNEGHWNRTGIDIFLKIFYRENLLKRDNTPLAAQGTQ
jgi:hypothetical protein